MSAGPEANPDGAPMAPWWTPLALAFRAGWASWAGRALLLGMCFYGSLTVASLVASPVRELLLRRHQTGLPWAAWVALQPLPSMYNYEQWATVHVGESESKRRIAHHPYRILGDLGIWALGLPVGTPARVVLHGRFRGTAVQTHLWISWRGSALVVERGQRR